MTRKPLVSFAKILLTSYVLTALLLLLTAFILHRFRLSDNQLSIGVNLTYGISCFIGGLLSGKLMKQRKFVWGLLFGLLYLLLLVLVSFIMHKGILQGVPHLFTVLAVCLAGGFLGSVVS